MDRQNIHTNTFVFNFGFSTAMKFNISCIQSHPFNGLLRRVFTLIKALSRRGWVFKYVCTGIMAKGRFIISTSASYAIDGDSVSRYKIWHDIWKYAVTSHKRYGVSNYRHCLLDSLFRVTTKESLKLRIADPSGRDLLAISGFLTKGAVNAERISGRHHITLSGKFPGL